MANSVNPKVCSGSTLFVCILKFASNVWQLCAADDFSRRHFQMHFLGALRVNLCHAEYFYELHSSPIFYPVS